MELKEFIRETIVQVVDGVSEAQTIVQEKGAKVNPKEAMSANSDLYMNSREYIGLIKFEIALTSGESRGKNGTIGVLLGGVGLGAQGKLDSKSESVTNIEFSIPVEFPKI